jgi:protein-tyrosine phosphatase
VIDLHSHVLAGLDDGARTVEDSLGIARAAVAAGVTVLAATPHVRKDYPTTAEAMERALAATRTALAAEAIPLELLPGAEVDLDRLVMLEEAELRRLGLGGNPRLLLVEFPYVGWPPSLAATLEDLRRRGFTVVLAHPERNPEVQAAPARLAPLVEAGTYVQLTAASVVGKLGRTARSGAADLLELELAHLAASDAHSSRAPVSAAQLGAALGFEDALVRWLTLDVPAALLADARPPERPARQRRWARSVLRFRR